MSYSGVVLATGLMFFVACTNSQFSGGDATSAKGDSKTSGPNNISSGNETEGVGSINFGDDYLDISGLDKNKTTKEQGGPQGGTATDSGKPFTQDFALGCEENKIIQLGPLTPDQARVGTTITGEFCPTITHELNILFIVDNSGSMGRHLDTETMSEQTGNDPQTVDGNSQPTCGRLRAARAVIRKFQEDAYKDLKTTISVISFASDVVATSSIKTLDEALSESLISEKIFCETVIQGWQYSQPGGLTVPGINSSTNYQAPLNRAQTMLKDVTGQKLVYFITDGNPNTPGPEANGIALGIAAGLQLRNAVPDLSINAMFLKALNPDEAKNILAQLTGSQDRVLIADNPDDLEKKIVEFPPVGFSPDSAKAVLNVAPYPEEQLKVGVVADPQKIGTWVYKTQPFILQGKSGDVVDNVVAISAQGLDGKEYRATITIQYKLSN